MITESSHYLWHNFIRRYNLYLDKVTTVLLTLRKSPYGLIAETRKNMVLEKNLRYLAGNENFSLSL